MTDICKIDGKSKSILADADPVEIIESKMKAVVKNYRQSFIPLNQGFIALTPGDSETKNKILKSSITRIKHVLEQQRDKCRATIGTLSEGADALEGSQERALFAEALKGGDNRN